MGSVRVEVLGADRAARAMLRGRSVVPSAVEAELHGDLAAKLASDGTGVYPDAAPKRSRRLAEQIHTEVRGQTLEVISDVASKTGFHYTRITRFGHNVEFIYPKAPRRALRFEVGGRTLFRARVRGYKPSVDWADAAFPAADREAADAADRIAREIGAAL